MKMILQNISDRLTECVLRLGSGCYTGWILLAILIFSIVMLILAARAQARSRD